jgi:cytochrome c
MAVTRLRRRLGRTGRVRGAWIALCLTVATAAGTGSAEDGFARLEGHGGPVKGVAVSPDGARALTAGFDYSVGVWALADAQLTRWLEGHGAAVNAVAFLPEGARALSAGDDGALILWDLAGGERLQTFDGHRGKIVAIEISPDGRIAATSGWDGRVGLWDLAGESPVRWLQGHEGYVNDAAFSRDGRTLYTASEDGTIARWDLARGALEGTIVRHGFGINVLALNEAAGWLAYGAVDGAVRALDLATGERLADLTADRRPILALERSPDGRVLAAGDGQGYVSVIDSKTWSIERDFRAAVRGPVWALAWTPDGLRLVSAGMDDAVAVWPIAAPAETVEGVLADAGPRIPRAAGATTNGERQFLRKCSVCHTLGPDGARRAGPTLYGLFGRRAGSVAGYRYSEALAESRIVWDAATIDGLFSMGPDHYTPGSKMPMQRITGAEDRRDLIKFLAANTGPRGGGERTK